MESWHAEGECFDASKEHLGGGRGMLSNNENGCVSLVLSLNYCTLVHDSIQCTHLRWGEAILPPKGWFWVAFTAPCRHHRLKYGNLRVTKKSEAVTTDSHFEDKRRLAELRSMYKEAVQTDSECFRRYLLQTCSIAL